MTMNTQEPAWIEWTGGDCPVAAGTDCEVQFRNGYISRDDDPEEWEWNRQSECRDFEIIAYRVWQTAWQAQALAAGWSPPTAPDLATVLAFESGKESMRAEIERLNNAIKTQAAAVRTLRANEETELSQLREERKKWHGAISALDSERAANAILTAEFEMLRLDLDAKDALNVSAYYAGMKAGWNFCVNEDQINFAAAIASTEHIAELQRINAARQALGDPA